MYIQDKVKEYADEVFTRMDNGAHMYFCGLKGVLHMHVSTCICMCTTRACASCAWAHA